MQPLTIYVETSIVSYLTARSSRDLILAGRQATTREWWERAIREQRLVTSVEVIQEAARGDPQAAQARVEVLSALPRLELGPPTEALAARYQAVLGLPERAASDAVHLAVASLHQVDAIASWNCCHIASPRVQRIVMEINQQLGLSVPYLATPEMLMGEEAADVP